MRSILIAVTALIFLSGCGKPNTEVACRIGDQGVALQCPHSTPVWVSDVEFADTSPDSVKPRDEFICVWSDDKWRCRKPHKKRSNLEGPGENSGLLFTI